MLADRFIESIKKLRSEQAIEKLYPIYKRTELIIARCETEETLFLFFSDQSTIIIEQFDGEHPVFIAMPANLLNEILLLLPDNFTYPRK